MSFSKLLQIFKILVTNYSAQNFSFVAYSSNEYEGANFSPLPKIDCRNTFKDRVHVCNKKKS